MKTIISTLALLALLSGCAFRVAPGSEPAVVYAEVASETTLDVFDTFLKWERNNEAALLKADPSIHKFADSLRDNGKRWIQELNAAIRAYKANRTPDNRNAMIIAQQILDLAIAECRQWATQVPPL